MKALFQYSFLFVFCFAVNAAETFIISKNGSELGNGPSYSPSISAKANRIVFESTARNLINDGVTNRNIYLLDRTTNKFTRLSVSNSGDPGNANSLRADIDSNGTLAVFESFANNLTANSGSKGNIFLRNITNNITTLVSKTHDGSIPNGISSLSQISGNGKYIVFHSRATNLAPNDNNQFRDIFIFDVVNNSVQLISSSPDGSSANGDSNSPSISDDGRYISYISVANNIDPIDDNNKYDVFLWDRETGTSELISKTFDGSPLVANNRNPYISGNGKYIAFISDAKNLVAGTNATFRHVFLYNKTTDSIILISKSSEGIQANNVSLIPKMSNNGRFVSYVSKASNLVSNDSNDSSDLFVYDTILGTTERVSLTHQGQQLNANIDFVSAINDNGEMLTFSSSASNLGSNNHTQINLRVRDTIPNIQPVANAGIDQVLLCNGLTTNIQLDGSQSNDPDSEQSLAYTWTGTFGSNNLMNPVLPLATGIHNINLQVRDNSDALDSDNVIISINDYTPPQIHTPSYIMLEATSLQGAHYLVTINATDNCSIPNTTISINDSWFPVGFTDINMSAIDASGNASSLTSTIQVADTTPPILSTPENIISEATSLATKINIGSAQAEDIFPVTITNNAPTALPLGQTLVTWHATDSNGNTSVAVQEIIIIDTTAPTFTIIETKNRLWPPNRKLEHMLSINRLKDIVDESPNLDINISTNLDIKKHPRRHRYNKPFWDIRKTEDGWDIWLKKTRIPRSNENLIYTIVVTASDESGNIKSKTYYYEVKHLRKYSKKRSHKYAHKHHKMEQHHVKIRKHHGKKKKSYKRKYKKPHKYNNHGQAKKKKHRRNG